MYWVVISHFELEYFRELLDKFVVSSWLYDRVSDWTGYGIGRSCHVWWRRPVLVDIWSREQSKFVFIDLNSLLPPSLANAQTKHLLEANTVWGTRANLSTFTWTVSYTLFDSLQLWCSSQSVSSLANQSTFEMQKHRGIKSLDVKQHAWSCLLYSVDVWHRLFYIVTLDYGWLYHKIGYVHLCVIITSVVTAKAHQPLGTK